MTLNKADFVRGGARGATYLAYRKAVQEAVSRQLALWGDARDAGEPARRRAARPVERDLEAVLIDLADEFPLLATLVEQRAGGQRRLPAGRPSPRPDDGHGPAALLAVSEPESAEPIVRELPPAARAETGEPAAEAPEGAEPAQPRTAEARLPGARGPRQPARYGLSIKFEARPNDSELARLVESTVRVNEAHPAYRRAVASRSEGYHLALATALALAPLAVEPAKEHAFVTAFLTSWGAAIERQKSSRRR
ncbi:MAG: hypothetical protein DME11_02465 [Candidatus Rokuibacteriota bacterium]|nr:MAG: hypothetical protein DME11_02465 [Candidatus Rokubacteria bacterium]